MLARNYLNGRIPFHWVVLGTVTIGLFVSSAPVVIFTFGVFLKPLIAEFGWHRGPISIVLTVYAISAALFMPMAGRLIDKYGARQITLISFVGYALVVMLLGALPGILLVWYAAFIMMAFIGSCCGPLPYAKILISWFERHRGLALGIAISSVGIGSLIFSSISQFIIDHDGWRFAYVCLGIIVLFAGFPLLYLFLRNTPGEMGMLPDGLTNDNHEVKLDRVMSGLSIKEALRSKTFWLLFGSFMLPSIAIAGVTLHITSLLSDRGMTPQLAATALGALGMASTFGRLLVGWLLDRFFAPNVAIIFFLIPSLACMLLAAGATGYLGFLSAVFIGLGIGAEIDIIAYVTSRYFGLKYFTELYGYLFGAFSVGAALGAVIMGFGYDFTGDYVVPLIISTLFLLMGCALLKMLGPYPVSFPTYPSLTTDSAH